MLQVQTISTLTPEFADPSEAQAVKCVWCGVQPGEEVEAGRVSVPLPLQSVVKSALHHGKAAYLSSLLS